MKDQEMKEMSLEYKDGYDATCNGVINLRFQYVHNERVLFKQLVEKYQEQEDLIEKFTQSLSSFNSGQRKTTPDTLEIDESNHSQKAGFYSYVEDESALGTSQVNSPDKRFLIRPENFGDEYSYDMMSSNLINHKDDEEDKSEGVALSLHPGW